MALFRKNPIKPEALMERLIGHPAIRKAQSSAPVDVAAALMGLAEVESGFDQGAEGDKTSEGTQAWGLWQINSRVHPVDIGRVLGDLNYQIDLAAKVYGEIDSVIGRALAGKRTRVAQGVTFNYQPARDVPNFVNVGWQYGTGGLQQWLTSSQDWTAEGFAAHRIAAGRPAEKGYAARAANFRKRYLAVVATAPSFWTDVVTRSAADVGSIAQTGSLDGTALGEVVDKKTDELSKGLFAGVEKTFKEIRLYAGILVVIVLLGLIAWILTVTAPERRIVTDLAGGK